MTKEQKPEKRCGDCTRYEECNAELQGQLSPNETFPEAKFGCLSFIRKEEKKE